ncbi:hypothetical protein K435DRAFT_850290 [Dendrothele bispora CBS 962.96]|uniref:Uncharacterized protein n=1 Tax=Dendrothele bispora (strain CBS 962.96) TaxID=1314807 RepID=A0A4V4HI37_DENBC|nr:hypothetical protein K435DRAFT_850290 [Dendrothele bispora CBS 962.96]
MTTYFSTLPHPKIRTAPLSYDSSFHQVSLPDLKPLPASLIYNSILPVVRRRFPKCDSQGVLLDTYRLKIFELNPPLIVHPSPWSESDIDSTVGLFIQNLRDVDRALHEGRRHVQLNPWNGRSEQFQIVEILNLGRRHVQLNPWNGRSEQFQIVEILNFSNLHCNPPTQPAGVDAISYICCWSELDGLAIQSDAESPKKRLKWEKEPEPVINGNGPLMTASSSGDASQENLLGDIVELSERLKTVETQSEAYYNPTRQLLLPRLEVNSDLGFSFHGREIIKDILALLPEGNKMTLPRISLRTTVGAGSSSILASLATVLCARKTHYVVSIPESNLLLLSHHKWHENMTRALLIALSHHPEFKTLASEIFAQNSSKKLESYIRRLGRDGVGLTFVIDDFQEFYEYDMKQILSKFLQFVVEGRHGFILVDKGCSPLDLEKCKRRHKVKEVFQIKHFDIVRIPSVYSPDEMTVYWTDLKLRRPDVFSLFELHFLHDEFMRITGSTPKYLEILTQSFEKAWKAISLTSEETALSVLHSCAELNDEIQEVKSVFRHYLESAYQQNEKVYHISNLDSVFLASLAKGYHFELGCERLHPHFFVVQPMGDINLRLLSLPLGLLRESLDHGIRSFSNSLHLTQILSENFLTTLSVMNNPSVLSTVVEFRVLALIESQGIQLTGWKCDPLAKPHSKHRLSLRENPSFSLNEGPAYFFSVSRNTPAIDGLYICVKDVSKVHIFAIQVTIAERHSSSEALFFHTWKAWVDRLVSLAAPASTPVYHFLWIVDGKTQAGGEILVSDGRPEEIPELVRKTRNCVQVVKPDYTRWVIGIEDMDPKVSRLVKNSGQMTVL